MGKRKLNKDIARYTKLLRKEKRLEYFLTLGRLYESAEMLDAAEDVLREASKHFPDLSSVKVSLASVLNALERPMEARALLEPILSRDRDNLLAARRLAEAQELSGDLNAALRTYQGMLRFKLLGHDVNSHIERLERLVDSEAKTEDREKADSGFVGIPTLSLAKLYMGQGHYQEAIDVLTTILETDPQCEECQWLLSQAQEAREKSEAERSAVYPGMESEPESEPESMLESEVASSSAAEDPATNETDSPIIPAGPAVEPEPQDEDELAGEERDLPAKELKEVSEVGVHSEAIEENDLEESPETEADIAEEAAEAQCMHDEAKPADAGATEVRPDAMAIFAQLKRWLDDSAAGSNEQ